jgi:FAD/FMN-containing dehydrogenase
MTGYAERRDRLAAALRAGGPAPVALGKDISNLFRDRAAAARERLDVRGFDHVLEVDPARHTIEVEGMTPYSRLVDAALVCGMMPAVVPQLKSITIGGALAGVGIESSSFRYGLVHDTVQEIEVLTGTGEVVLARPDNEHRDLFRAFPNSYGTLGYALKLTTLAVPVRPFVRLTHRRFRDADEYFAALGAACAGDADFLDGVVFGPEELYLCEGRFADAAPYTSDYTYENIYYRSIRERTEDFLTTRDYLWRWDTDWFWCSKNVGAQHPLLRRLYGRRRLNSATYTKIMRWNSRVGLSALINRLLRRHTESVIQDVDIPLGHCAEYLDFFQREIKITPVWICPVQAWRKDARFPLYPLDPDETYVNFGFWDAVRSHLPHPEGYYTRRIEQEVARLGGIKSLYSDSYYPRMEFDRTYGGTAYRKLKRRYDPKGRFRDLYDKCVLRY